MKYSGSCHCGGIAFEVEGEFDEAISCNCSICSRKGGLLWFVPRASVKLLTPESAMATYRFHTKRVQHHFCPTCGIHPFSEGADPKGNPIAVVNIRCLDGVDLAAVPVRHFDGRSL